MPEKKIWNFEKRCVGYQTGQTETGVEAAWILVSESDSGSLLDWLINPGEYEPYPPHKNTQRCMSSQKQRLRQWKIQEKLLLCTTTASLTICFNLFSGSGIWKFVY